METATRAVDWDVGRGFGRRLRSREPLLGTVVTGPGVALAELVAESVDFAWIDLEHGALGVADVLPLAVACRAAGAAALVRLPSADADGVGAILDAGVEGVVAPRVDSADCAARLVARLHHPPRGSRGVAARRGTGYGRRGQPGACGAGADALCLAQIESPLGVEAAADIAAVDGVDCLVVGCADLSYSLGEGGRLRSPAVVEAIERVQLAAAAAGIASGIAGPDDPALLAELAAGRSTVLVLSADVRIYARAVESSLAALRQAQAVPTPKPLDAHAGS